MTVPIVAQTERTRQILSRRVAVLIERVREESDMKKILKLLEHLEWKIDCLANKLSSVNIRDISYTEELRMYHSCIDCQFLAQCQSDADLEDVQFDYLVCENFSEVIR